MDKRDFKNTVYSEIGALTKALSNPHRIEIIDLLANGEKTVDRISLETGLTFANASQHLQQLKNIRLLKIRREKNYIYYQLGNPYVYTIWKALREFSRYHIPEINQSIRQFHQYRNISPVSRKDLDQYSPYTVVDVRPEDEYKEHHMEGALNITVKNLPDSLGMLNKDNTIITYCRGPFCSLADEAADMLQRNGFKTFRLEDSAVDL